MTATISDIVLTGTAYQDVYAATGIVVGTPLIIQNKSLGTIWLQITATALSPSDRNGFMVFSGRSVSVENATEGLFVFGMRRARIHVAQDVVV